MSFDDLERIYESLATALNGLDEPDRPVFLAELVLLLAEGLDHDRVETCIEDCLERRRTLHGR